MRCPSIFALSFLAVIVCCPICPGQTKSVNSSKSNTKIVRIGAVAYSPDVVTVFDGIKQYLTKNGLAADYVLYSNYDALVGALQRGEVEIAWNTPLAHAQYHAKCGKSQTLVMRDVDRNIRSVLVVRKDAKLKSLEDLKGKTLVLGSYDAAEATVLPMYYLKQKGMAFDKVKLLELDNEFDFKGNCCSSPRYVWKALKEGRGQAGIIPEYMWKNWSKSPEAKNFRVIWTSPKFSHCVFTADTDFDKNLSARFTKLMLQMSPTDPLTADVMRLEGTRQWLQGTHEGFTDLIEAVKQQQK